VELKNISFRYAGAEEDALKNISFVEGEVLVNGVNVKDVVQIELRSQIGYVSQKSVLMSGTIKSKGVNFGTIANILLWLIGIYLISALFQFIQSFIMTGVSNKTSYRLRQRH
jgi:ABC-type multidrug transport system fused ATPase/permease subunit